MFDSYFKKGFYLFSTYGIRQGQCTCNNANCKNPGKHPNTPHGYKDAVSALLFRHAEGQNVALATGRISGCIVLDVDGEEGLNCLSLYPELPNTFTVKTGRGNHYYFKYNESVSTNQGLLGKGLEIKSDNASAHLPPSVHYSGTEYEIVNDSDLADLPDWIINAAINKSRSKNAPNSSRQHRPSSLIEADVYEMLDYICPDLAYLDWINIGMAIQAEGFPFKIWDDWSSKGMKYDKTVMNAHWRSFKSNGGVTMGTLINCARQAGYKGKLEARFSLAVGQTTDAIPKVSTTLEFDPLKIPGLIGDTVRWIEKHALYPQPELALLATLGFAGAVFGRRYASPFNTRTNVYVVGVAGTGTGKDHARKMISVLAAHANLSQFIGANSIRSESGLARSLETNASMLMMIDEFGLFLQAIGDTRAAPHAKQTSDLLMKLYSSSSGGLYDHGSYADKNMKPIQIFDPNLCVYGTTTEASYASSLQKGAIANGNINRFIVIKPTNDRPRPNHAVSITERDEALIARWKEFESKTLGEQVNGANVKPKINRISWGDCENIQRALLEEQTDKRDSGKLGALWVRMYENTIKIAMISAIARNRDNPTFCPEDFKLGESIVRPAIRYMETLCEDHMYESETEMHTLQILRFINEFPNVTKSEIIRHMRKLKKHELNGILDQLKDSNQIQVEDEPVDRPQNGGSSRKLYKTI